MEEKMEEKKHRSTVRALDVLELLADHPNGLLFKEIAENLDIPKSSIHPILQTLLARKYIRINETNLYYLGQQSYYVGSKYIKDCGLLQNIDYLIKNLSSSLKQTIYFAVLAEDGQVFYLLKQSYPSPIQITAAPGFRFPAYSTAIGKSLLSNKSLEQLHLLYPDGLKPVNENTIISWDTLYDQLQSVRQTGFSYEKEESTKYVQCISIPIKYKQNIIAAMSVAIPVFDYNDELESRAKELLLNTKNEIERLIIQNSSEWIYSSLKI
jgi:DNA-binding IclR family transcriptional regulator